MLYLLCSEIYHHTENFPYPDHIANYRLPDDNCRSWQGITQIPITDTQGHSGRWCHELSAQGGGLFEDAGLPVYIPWGSDAGGPEPINGRKAVQLQPALKAGKDVFKLAFVQLALDQDKYGFLAP